MKKLSLFFITLLAVTGLAAPLFSAPAYATFADDVKCTGDSCIQASDQAATGDCTKSDCDLIAKYLNPLIKLLGIGLGLAAAIGIAVGGVEYSSSGGDPQKAARGKNHIVVAILALFVYLFLYGLLKFLTAGAL